LVRLDSLLEDVQADVSEQVIHVLRELLIVEDSVLLVLDDAHDKLEVVFLEGSSKLLEGRYLLVVLVDARLSRVGMVDLRLA